LEGKNKSIPCHNQGEKRPVSQGRFLGKVFPLEELNWFGSFNKKEGLTKGNFGSLDWLARFIWTKGKGKKGRPKI